MGNKRKNYSKENTIMKDQSLQLYIDRKYIVKVLEHGASTSIIINAKGKKRLVKNDQLKLPRLCFHERPQTYGLCYKSSKPRLCITRFCINYRPTSSS